MRSEKIIVVIIGFLILFSCQSNSNDKVFRIAYAMAPGGTSHLGAVHFQQLVKQKSKDKIAVKLYPGGILGKEAPLIEGIQLNSVDMVIAGPSIIGNYAPKYGLIEAPFLFRDYNHLNSVLYGPIGKEIEKAVSKDRGLHFIDFFHRGPRYLTTTNTIVRTPEDLKGLKLRVPELPVYIKSWKIFGANPTPLDYSDMFIALRQGVVEGQENPLEVIYSNHLYEVQKYIMDTRHLLSFYVLVIGDSFYKKYSFDEQEILLSSAREAAAYHNKLVEEYELKYKQILIESGVEFIDVHRDQFESLAVDNLPFEFENEWESGIYNRIVNTK
ncbi:MAG: TRAP transporter substrate-binding protein [Cytophagales bacterium]|nr:TRAP transporter substrate-binding protein [Cytophagales bacterium]